MCISIAPGLRAWREYVLQIEEIDNLGGQIELP
jgi:hypothetical protein